MKEIMNRFLKNVLSNGEASSWWKKIFRGNIDTVSQLESLFIYSFLVGTEKYSLL